MLGGTTVQDPVVSAAVGVQGVLSRTVAGLDTRLLVAAALTVVAAGAWVLVTGLRGRCEQAGAEPQDARR